MALLPLLMNDLVEDRTPPVTLGELYNLGRGIGDLSLRSRRRTNYPALSTPAFFHPAWSLAGVCDLDDFSNEDDDEKEFKVRLDVTHFKPEELKVKMEDNGSVVVKGKHEERSDAHGYISRQFSRRYFLPADADRELLTSNLSSDGVLTLKAPRKPQETPAGREIKIVKTNQPAIARQEEAKAQAKDDAPK